MNQQELKALMERWWSEGRFSNQHAGPARWELPPPGPAKPSGGSPLPEVRTSPSGSAHVPFKADGQTRHPVNRLSE